MFRFERKAFDPSLQPYVTAYWEYDRYEPEPVIEVLPAVAVIHLEFFPEDPAYGVIKGRITASPKICFAGMLPEAGTLIQPYGHNLGYGITLTPMGLWRLFGVRCVDCMIFFLDYYDVCKDPPPDLGSTPRGGEYSALRFAMVNEWLLKLLRKRNGALSKIETFMHHLSESRGTQKVLSLIEEGSPRQMQRLFRELAGISPKHYARLVRFNRVLGLLAMHPKTTLLEAAVLTGYNDASHLCHDFKRLGAQLPGQWSASPSAHTASLVESLY